METFEKQIEGLTKITISDSGTSPTQSEITQFLRDGVKDIIRKLMASGAPTSILSSFATLETITNSNGLESPSNVIISVTRGDGEFQNPAKEIPALMKGRVSDSSSLFFASKYNPVYYLESGKIYIKPNPSTGSVDNGEIQHVIFDNQVSYNSVSIANFPKSTEYLVVYFASALSCLNAASNIHSAMPTSPTSPGSASFIYDAPDLPTVPEFIAPNLSLDFTDVNEALSNDDPDMAEKFLSVIEKQLDAYEKQVANADKEFNAENVEFTEEIKRRMTNADKQMGKQMAEITTDIKTYASDIQKYALDINKLVTTYKWYMQQYSFLMNQYMTGVSGMGGKPKAQQANAVQAPKQKEEGRE